MAGPLAIPASIPTLQLFSPLISSPLRLPSCESVPRTHWGRNPPIRRGGVLRSDTLVAVDDRIGKAFSPFECFFPRFHVDERVTRDKFLHLSKGAIDHDALSPQVLNAPTLGTRLGPEASRRMPAFFNSL